jgi:hypothetical protein
MGRPHTHAPPPPRHRPPGGHARAELPAARCAVQWCGKPYTLALLDGTALDWEIHWRTADTPDPPTAYTCGPDHAALLERLRDEHGVLHTGRVDQGG